MAAKRKVHLSLLESFHHDFALVELGVRVLFRDSSLMFECYSWLDHGAIPFHLTINIPLSVAFKCYGIGS